MQTKDLYFEIKISVKASNKYVNKLRNMENEEFLDHIAKSCFRNNERFLHSAKILNNGFQKDLNLFKKSLQEVEQ